MKRFMVLIRSAEHPAFGKPPPALFEAMDRFIAENMRSGVLVGTGGLAPTADGSRIRQSGGRLTVTDGPFAEAREVIGGYAIFQAASKADAMAQVLRFMDLHVEHWPEFEGETEIREIAGGPDCPAA